METDFLRPSHYQRWIDILPVVLGDIANHFLPYPPLISRICPSLPVVVGTSLSFQFHVHDHGEFGAVFEYLFPLLWVSPNTVRYVLPSPADMIAHCVIEIDILYSERLFDPRRHLVTWEKNETLAKPLVLGFAVIKPGLETEHLFDGGHAAERKPTITCVVIFFRSKSGVLASSRCLIIQREQDAFARTTVKRDRRKDSPRSADPAPIQPFIEAGS